MGFKIRNLIVPTLVLTIFQSISAFCINGASFVEELRETHQKIAHCGPICQIEIGGERITISLPAIGEGERGVVYRILGSWPQKVIKIAKPEAKSIEILAQESESHRFWQALQPKSFSVPALYHSNSFGKFSIMEEIRGETLTEALVRLGAIQINHYTNEVVVNSKFKPDASHEAIWSAIQEMSNAINSNPKWRTSMSPNNFMVVWDQTYRVIEKVVLIDLGTDGSVDERSFKLTSYLDYLKLSAQKIRGYLEKPGFTTKKLSEIALAGKQVNSFEETFDTRVQDQMLLEFALSLWPKDGIKNIGSVDLLNKKIPENLSMRISIDNTIITPIRSILDLIEALKVINSTIKNLTEQGKVKVAKIRFGEASYIIKLPALGQGDRGVVYAIEGTDKVIKLPKPNLISLLTLFQEKEGYHFWYAQSLESKGKFTVPLRERPTPLGTYSVMQRDKGEPLTKALVRLGLIKFDPDSRKASIDNDVLRNFDKKNKEIVMNAIF